MSRETKPSHLSGMREIVYKRERWKLLDELRADASRLMEPLAGRGMDPIVHGSVARGDVKQKSDVDIFIPHQLSPYLVEFSLNETGFQFMKREIIMATPWQLPKAYILINEGRSVSFPLAKPKQEELEFYYFGGALNLQQLKEGMRTPGVDKRLVLIEPTEKGHVESPIIGREAEVSKLLNINLRTVQERVQVLTRRGRVGRTGVFFHRTLAPGESFEEVLREIARKNPAFKSRLRYPRQR